jgi:alginate O-acetyltransferase complex protein AlgI
MIFSSLSFLFFFFPLVFTGYMLINVNYANAWLLAASLFFYYAGAGEHICILIGMIGVAYISGILISTLHTRNRKRIALTGSLCTMLGIMGYYKYWNFLTENINMIFHKGYDTGTVLLPIGISFFTFQAVSYVVDIYRGEKPLKNPIDLALYISFFPQLIAGPIVRFHDIKEYLGQSSRKFKMENLETGFWRFCTGLCKKVLLANNLGILSDIVFGVRDVTQCSVLYVWLGVLAYTLQIYYDFSGYSDMAIGLGRIFGFAFRENFNYPYIACSIHDFWRRWHISLSLFFRDYVYIPLGGNRCSSYRWVCNMMIVWGLTGLWHGASWNYIFWGLLYGSILIAERLLLRKVSATTSTASNVLRHVYTLTIVMILWTIFRADTILHAEQLVKAMFGIGARSLIDQAFIYQAENFAVLLLLSIIFCRPLPGCFRDLSARREVSFLYTIILTVCVMASVSYIYMGSYNPFLYFMF